MIGEPRLARVQRIGQIADALLAIEQARDDLHARLIGEGIAKLRDAGDVQRESGHKCSISYFLDTSTLAAQGEQAGTVDRWDRDQAQRVGRSEVESVTERFAPRTRSGLRLPPNPVPKPSSLAALGGAKMTSLA